MTKSGHIGSLAAVFAIAGFSSCASFERKQAAAPGESGATVWLNAAKRHEFAVEGLPWFSVLRTFRRLPLDPNGTEFSKEVNDLADNTAGAVIRFRTNSRTVKVRVQLSSHSFMDHMPATGQSGIDLYDEIGGRFRFCGVTRLKPQDVNYESELCSWKETAWREIALNLPLYNGVRALEIGISSGSRIDIARMHRRRGKIVVYGTSITQGAVASRPGLGWVNQLGRALDQEIVNLGFSGSGLGEPALARRIAEIGDLSLIILDYEANAQKGILSTLEPFIEILRAAHSDLPIVVMSQIPWVWEFRSAEYSKFRDDLRRFQSRTVTELRARGDANLYFIDGNELMPRERFEEGLVDGVHPNDLGMTWIAEGVGRRLEGFGLLK